jgi:hypothetical protein
MKRILQMAALASVALLAVGTGRASAQAGDPLTVFNNFIEFRTTNPEAALGIVADDVVIQIVPAPPGTTGIWTGKQEVGMWLQFVKSQFISQEIVGEPRVDGNKVTATYMVYVNDFRKWGIGSVRHTFEGVVEGGKIKTFTASIAPEERQRVANAAQAFAQSQSQAQAPAGMPRTGAGQDALFQVLALVAAIAALAGLTMRRVRRA